MLRSFLIPGALILLVFSSISCSSFSLFRGDAEVQPTDAAGISAEKLQDLENRLADLDTQQAAITARQDNSQATIEQLSKKTAALEKKLATATQQKQPEKSQPAAFKVTYKTPEDLYTKARNLLLEEDFQKAAASFSTFIDHFPSHSLTDNAVYWLGECYYTTGKFHQAVMVFKSLVKQYPKSEKVPDALLKTGYSYLSLEDSNRAHHFLKQVLKQYPFSPAAEKAQQKLSEFK